MNRWWDGHPDLLPPDPDLEPLHQREYLVRAWRVDDSSMLIRGAIMDLKPGQMFAGVVASAGGHPVEGPLTMHHMILDLTIAYPSLEITDVNVHFEAHPQPGCPTITAHYKDLIGVSIARGFTHRIRDLFGGPRGCTHTTALLQAMGPVAMQCVFSMRRQDGAASKEAASRPDFMKGTCHVWAEDGRIWQDILIGKPPPMGLPLQERLRRSGLDPERLAVRADS